MNSENHTLGNTRYETVSNILTVKYSVTVKNKRNKLKRRISNYLQIYDTKLDT